MEPEMDAPTKALSDWSEKDGKGKSNLRSRWSSVEPRKNGLVGDWMRPAMDLYLRAVTWLELRASAIGEENSLISPEENLALSSGKRRLRRRNCRIEVRRTGKGRTGLWDWGLSQCSPPSPFSLPKTHLNPGANGSNYRLCASPPVGTNMGRQDCQDRCARANVALNASWPPCLGWQAWAVLGKGKYRQLDAL